MIKLQSEFQVSERRACAVVGQSRAIQRYVEDPLSEELIRGNLESGEIEIYLENGTVAYRMVGEAVEGHKLA